jgi:hypothetical protein
VTITSGLRLAEVAGTAEDIERARARILQKKGRPSLYSPELAAEIFLRLESGESLTAVCRDDHMPHISQIYKWRGELPHFDEGYRRATKQAATSYAHTGLDMLDDLEKPKYDENGEIIPLSMVAVRLAETRAKYRKDLAKDYDRDTFGDRLKVDQTVAVETVEQQIQRLTGGSMPVEVVNLLELEE